MRLSRRRVLAGTGSSIVVGVTGCLTGGGGGNADETTAEAADETTAEATDEAAPTTTDTDGQTEMEGDTETDADGDTDTDADGDTETETESETTTEAGESTGATVQVRSHSEHGEILVDADGMTLYMFDSDTNGSGSSTCSGDCASNWPPLTVDGDPVAGDDATAELTTFSRDDGSTQVAADGWPLYYFAPDESPGDAKGQGVGDVWWVLRPDGTPVKPSSTGTEYGY